VLPQFKSSKNPPAHKFIVFSEILDSGDVKIKYSQCNNCGVIHRITDICKSEIIQGKDSMTTLISVDDIRPCLHQNFVNILDGNSADLATWEAVQHIIENKRWGEVVILTKESEGQEIHGKYIRILGETLCKVESFVRSTGVI
jgi:hypothetical protein